MKTFTRGIYLLTVIFMLSTAVNLAVIPDAARMAL